MPKYIMNNGMLYTEKWVSIKPINTMHMPELGYGFLFLVTSVLMVYLAGIYVVDVFCRCDWY